LRNTYKNLSISFLILRKIDCCTTWQRLFFLCGKFYKKENTHNIKIHAGNKNKRNVLRQHGKRVRQLRDFPKRHLEVSVA